MRECFIAFQIKPDASKQVGQIFDPKRIYKVKEPLGESENALPLQIVAAFVTDLALRAFKHCGGFKGTLYKFVKT